MKTELEIQQDIQLESPRYGMLQRNNSGAFTDSTGRVVRYGLGNVSKKLNDQLKSSDLIGITVVTITPDMVGQKLGVFTAIEVKAESWKYMATARERAQLAFIDWVNSLFGFAGFAQSVDDYKKIISRG